MREPRRTQIDDRIKTIINVVIGVLVVLVADGAARLGTTELWPLAVVMPLLVAGLVLFEKVFNRLIDWEFPSEVQPARKSKAQGFARFARLLSLPVGIAIGLILALFGLTDATLAMV
ncbi:hypothetical protein [Roseovarius sp. 217]|uniref:hypothetical protein n=1 Tax=Roseovarius sp. (strain 217) TaxID=314264 RepID=UPI00006864D6|nr:hypothetical protein [Roseovarius sp. 217]EAQ23912.1 hypothetical protein ROS217_15295 [Roseovarius sp. 217]